MTRLLAASSLALLLSAAPARAAEPPYRANPPGGAATVWAILGYGDAWGIGARYRLSLVPEGLLQGPNHLRDSLDLEVGLDFIDWYGWNTGGGDYGYNMVAPRVGLMWDLWVRPDLAFYPKLDLGVGFGSYTGTWPATGRHEFSGLFLEPAVGMIWRVRDNLSLRGELSTIGLKLGLGFDF
jgi:hypothetical protein